MTLNKYEPLVSICLLSYNDEQFIGQAIQDLLEQDHKNIELIISDDCSKDNSPEIIQDFAKKDQRIRFFIQGSRLGMQGNYNYLLGQAQGQYFMWASSDDRWAPTYISTLLAIYRDNPAATSAAAPFLFIQSDCRKIDGISKNQNQHRLLNYEGKVAFVRLGKLAFYYFDDFFYGLHRRSGCEKLRVPVWWGLNKHVAWNNNYPVQAYLLARGQYVRAKGQPLFFKRLSDAAMPRHSDVPYRSRGLGSFAYILRKINVWVETLKSIHNGSGSIALTISVAPLFLIRCVFDCARYIIATIKKINGKQLLRH